MEQFVNSGQIATVMLVVLAIEIAVAGYYFWRRQRTFLLLSFVANGLAGAALVLALRAALPSLLVEVCTVRVAPEECHAWSRVRHAGVTGTCAARAAARRALCAVGEAQTAVAAMGGGRAHGRRRVA